MSNLKENPTRSFRHLQAGGWASIQMPAWYKDEAKDSYRSVFWGKVLSLTLRAGISESGAYNCSVMITLGSFITPFTTGETRKTPFRMGKINEIDPTAMGSYNVKNNAILKTILDHLNTLRTSSGAETNIDMAQSLAQLIETLGHFEVPDSIAPRKGSLNKCARLGDEIYMLGHHDQVIDTIYSSNASNVNTIYARPEESVFQNAFMQRTQTMWGLIQSLYQPSTDLIELFPVLIPLPPSEKAISKAGGEGTEATMKAMEVVVTEANLDETNQKFGRGGTWWSMVDGKWVKTEVTDMNPFVVGQTVRYSEGLRDVKNKPLVNKLKAIPYIMYRYKPIPPDFHADAPAHNTLNRLAGGLRSFHMRGKTAHEEHFGTSRTDEVPPQFVNINEGLITSFDLTWNETERINAINLSLPYNKAGTGDLNLFGVECVPVFNQQDINRHGLRMFNMHTPFAGASWEETAEYHRTASSGIAERLYWLMGEGHCYAEGTITMVYTPNPDLLAGIWCKTAFDQIHLFRSSNQRHPIDTESPELERPLTYYVTSVSHSITMDTATGKPSGSTTLRVERASFGNRIPKIDLNQVRSQMRPEKKVDPKKKTSRKQNRRGR